MAFVILEGVDRSFKSSLAKLYESQGYKSIHFSAPDKKYSQPGYTGPSYLDDLVEMLVGLSGQDVVFDRSWYGESSIWPFVYGRKPLLTDDDIDVLRDIEDQNSTTRILMIDTDIEAHWQRCVENKEPLSLSQFKSAYQLYAVMADRYGFSIKTKHDFVPQEPEVKEMSPEPKLESKTFAAPVSASEITNVVKMDTPTKLTPEQQKLQQANAINDILSSRIVKKKGSEYDSIEIRVREFLNQELAKLLGTDKPQVSLPFTSEEITLLKALANRVKDKRA
jgi:hypothetical protein